MVLLVLMVAMAALTSLGTTSPLYIIEQAMYLPCLGSHLAIMLAGSKQLLVISATESCSWQAFSAEMMGEQDDNMKWIRGQGTRLVWNSVTSTLRAPSNLREAVREEMTWEMSLLRLVQVGLSMSRFLLQMSQMASLSSMTATSVCSKREWVERMELQGSTTAVETWGEGQMVKPSLDFFPQSTESLSRRREPNPDPVPPPTEWNMRKPWRPVQLSASFLILSRQRSTISLPIVQ